MRLIDADDFKQRVIKVMKCVPLLYASETRQEYFDEILNQQPTVEIPQWIPCSDRLPENEEEVFVWFEYFRYGKYNKLFQTQGVGYIFNGEWSGFINGTSGWSKLRVIAWQPLPGPYKGE